LSKARGSFGHEITGLPPATFPVSHGNNLDACDFAHFAADDVKGRKLTQLPVTTQEQVKPDHQPFVAPSSTDNRVIEPFMCDHTRVQVKQKKMSWNTMFITAVCFLNQGTIG